MFHAARFIYVRKCNDALFSINRSAAHLTATVSLPVVGGFRGTFTSKQFEPSQELEAKTHAAKLCLEALAEADQLDGNYDPVTGVGDHVCDVEWPAACREQVTMGQVAFADLLNAETWPEVVLLIRVEPVPKPDGWMGL